MPQHWIVALDDIKESTRRVKLAFFLALRDSIFPYRVAYLGPLWMTIQTALTVAVVAFFLGPTVGKLHPSYLVYVAFGISLYTALQVFISGGVGVFVDEKNLILNVPNPFMIYVLKIAAKSAIQLAMAVPVMVVALSIDGHSITPAVWLAVPALLVCFVFGLGVTLGLGTLGTRYRDLIFATRATMRLLFFATPVFWIVDQTNAVRAMVANANPLYHLITLVRDPFLGRVPDAFHWVCGVGSAATALALGILLFAWNRGRMAIWL